MDPSPAPASPSAGAPLAVDRFDAGALPEPSGFPAAGWFPAGCFAAGLAPPFHRIFRPIVYTGPGIADRPLAHPFADVFHRIVKPAAPCDPDHGQQQRTRQDVPPHIRSSLIGKNIYRYFPMQGQSQGERQSGSLLRDHRTMRCRTPGPPNPIRRNVLPAT